MVLVIRTGPSEYPQKINYNYECNKVKKESSNSKIFLNLNYLILLLKQVLKQQSSTTLMELFSMQMSLEPTIIVKKFALLNLKFAKHPKLVHLQESQLFKASKQI